MFLRIKWRQARVARRATIQCQILVEQTFIVWGCHGYGSCGFLFSSLKLLASLMVLLWVFFHSCLVITWVKNFTFRIKIWCSCLVAFRTKRLIPWWKSFLSKTKEFPWLKSPLVSGIMLNCFTEVKEVCSTLLEDVEFLKKNCPTKKEKGPTHLWAA